MSENELLEHFSIMDEIKVIRVISWLIETNKIIRLPDMNYLGINKYCKFNCLIIIIGMEELTEELITKLSTYHWSIIVAHDLNLCIGKNNDMPWHLSSDLKRFKEITMGHPIVMGKNTYLSLPKNHFQAD